MFDFIQSLYIIVNSFPDNIAISSETEKISYAKLWLSATNLSIKLTERGIGPGCLVGIEISKSSEYIIAICAVWIAKAAFVPIDPELPNLRKEYYLNNARPNCTILNNFVVKYFHQTQLYPKSLAYVFFTSGSTGQPKGVLIPYHGVLNFLKEQIKLFQLDSSSRSLFFLSTQFDASISDIGTTLLSGATLCIPEQNKIASAINLPYILKKNGITHMDIPPSLLAILDIKTMPNTLQTIIIGGETCPSKIIKRWAEKYRLINVYGPTEATVCTSMILCQNKSQYASIGRPISQIIYEIFNESGEPAEQGELYISGVGLALGYLNNPKLTAKKFIQKNNTRWYRTGDIVKKAARGEFIYLGRLDRQNKINGQLVDPAEIEATLNQHPNVQYSAVLIICKKSQRKQIVAFVQATKITSNVLLHFLSRFLPTWMIPNRLIIVDFIPKNQNGKIDYSKLLSYDFSANQNNTKKLNRLLSKLDVEREVRDDSERRTGMYESIHEDSCTESTKKFASALNFRNKSNISDCQPSYKNLFQDVSVCRNSTNSSLNYHSKLTPKKAESNDDDDFINKQLQHLFKKTLKLKYLPSIHENVFHEYGIHSLDIINLIVNLEIHGFHVSIEQLKYLPTLYDLSCWLKQKTKFLDDALSTTILKKECYKIQTVNISTEHDTNSIFLTGATGFVGIHLLEEFLKNTNNHITCLIRAENKLKALEKLSHTANLYKVNIPLPNHRIDITLGDIALPKLGINQDEWTNICNKTNRIVHCAAEINMTKSFKELRKTNLQAVEEIIKIASTGNKKHLSYISTLSVFVATDHNPAICYENDTLEMTNTVYGGYAQSKWAAEYLLRKQNLDISIFRLGLITGHSKSGQCSKQDFFSLFIDGLKEMQYLPQGDWDNIYFDATPVDYAVSAIRHLILNAPPQCYHIANTMGFSLHQVIKGMANNGILLKKCSKKEWFSKQSLKTSMSSTYLALCRLLPQKNQAFERFRTMDLFQATGMTFDQKNTKRYLANTKIVCPKADYKLLNTYLSKILSK